MNKRISKKTKKRKLNTPVMYRGTGGFLTPYACPSCNALYGYRAAYNTNVCQGCGQKLIWWDADSCR